MSGDVQPRKRKDKKKKRDAFDRKSEGEVSFSRHASFEDDESSHGVHMTKMGSDDVHLHVQHDHDTGGHWCAKIFFFSLLAILLGLVALIILENRGLSDLDTPLSESRFSNYFDGWVEENRQDHDDHDPVQASIEEHDEHDEPFEEEDDHSELDEEADEEDDNHDNDDEEDDEDEHDTNDPENDETNDGNDEEEDEEEGTEEATANEEDDDEDTDVNDNNDNEDDDDVTKEAITGEDIDDADEDDDNDDDDEVENNSNEKTVEASREDNDDGDNDAAENDSNANTDDNNDDDDGDDDDDVEPIYERSTQQASKNQRSHTNNGDDDDDDPFDEEDDDDTFDSLENIVDNDAEELLLLQEKARQQAAQAAKNEPASAENDNEDTAEAVPSWTSSLAVKIGVGVALAVVARLVLVRNNPNTNEEPAPEVAMKRRLTIATEEVKYSEKEEEPTLSDDEYSEEEIEIEEEYEYEEEVEMDANDVLPALAGDYIPETFEQLNNMYRPRKSEPNVTVAPASQPIEVVKDRHFAHKKSPAVFIAPPPPSIELPAKKVTSITAAAIKSTPAPTSTAIVTQTQAPATSIPTTSITKAAPIKPVQQFTTTTTTEPSPHTAQKNMPDSPKPAKHNVTHDIDYQSDDEDIDYDDDEVDGAYERGELSGEEEEDDEGDLDEDLLDDEDISDVDDTELMNRLEAKYGRLPAKEYESDEDPDDPTWTQIKPKKDNFAVAVKQFSLLALRHPDRPQAFLGQAKVLDKLAERQRSNQLLSQALAAYKRYLALSADVTDDTEYRAAAERCIERMRFMGHHTQAVPIHQQLIERFANEPIVRNQLAVTYLLQNRLSDAKLVLQETLKLWPMDGFAQVHYGFVLRQLDKDYQNAVVYLRQGIKSNAPGTQDGRFFFNLGDSLQRLGRQPEAMEVYKQGAAMQLFPSVYQRSLYNEPHLRAQPFWSKAETTYATQLQQLEFNWQSIRDEALSLLGRRGYFLDETESLRDTGDWQQYELYARGQRRAQNCQKAPITCGLIEQFQAAHSCRRGQVKFSVMQPGTHVHAHCGPTNCRLRAHLGLVVPTGTRLRVADEERTWTEGEFLIFDDSFEHEVWHNGSSLRLVLIVDVWHPDLSAQQRQTLSPI